MTLQEHIEKVLDQIINPTLQAGLITTNNVKGLHVDEDGKVAFVLDFPATQVELGMKLREKAIAKIKCVPGVTDVSAVVTSDKKPRPTGRRREQIRLPGVTDIIFVGSGKGGVGKSTTAVNLACALSQLNLNVGLLDADVYGPSLPRMMNVNQRPESLDGKRMKPVIKHGIQCMSMGFMMTESLPAIWRGPMVQSAIKQMLEQVEWQNIDVLVIDLPPGTGDVPISLIQNYVIRGAVVVSTPQDISLIDARKAVNMFSRMETPILGLIENMSYFQCPHCQQQTDIFHHGGARNDADRMNIPFLGEIPLDTQIRKAGDEGMPLALLDPDSHVGRQYGDIAKIILHSIRRSQATTNLSEKVTHAN